MTPAIGQAIIRKDGFAKVTGTARYTADWPEKNIVHAVIVQSNISHGRIRSFDLKLARKVPGVIEILTYQNSPKIHAFNPKVKQSFGDAEIPLQSPSVYYLGQAIAVVLAESIEAAEQAAKLVFVTYRVDESALGFEQKVYEGQEKKKRFDSEKRKVTQKKGDINDGLKKSSIVVKNTYTLPIENHHPIETSSTIAVFAGDHLKVYDTTQGVSRTAQALAHTFDVKDDHIQLISKFLGGGFGCKGSVWHHELLAVMAAKKTKRAVKLVLTRSQMATNVGYRSRTIQNLNLGCGPDGKLQAIEHETVNPTAINKDYPETTGALIKLLYDSPNISTTQNVIPLHYPVPTFMRAPGECSGSFALESAMDELAHELKMDPIALRLKNYAEKDPMKDIPFSSKSLKECYEQGAQKFGWSKRKANPKTNRQGDYFFGHGMATSSYPVHFFPTEAKIELKSDGTARVTSGSQDLGTGTYTVMGQLAADALGLPYEKINFDLGDSHYSKAGVSGGSSTVSSLGWAISDASKKVFEQIMELAARDRLSAVYGLKSEEMRVENARVHSKTNPEKGESIFDIMKRNAKTVIVGEGKLDEKEQKKREKEYSQHAYGAQFAEVKVHAITGEVKLTRMVGAFAAGKIVNPRTARSQYMGGMIFGIGMGLTEQNFVDERNGKFMLKDLGDYHVPVNLDVPDLDIIFVNETDTITNPAGTKGIGEIGTVGTAAAIANAVFNATGIRIRDMPITPDKIIVELTKRA